MKLLVLIGLIFSATISYSQKTLQNDDIIKSNYLRLNIDGLELWDIHPSVREQKLREFYEKCRVDIPERAADHEAQLDENYNFFDRKDFTRKHKVLKYKTRYGDLYICRAEINVLSTSKFHFSPEYSEIFYDRRGTYELCKEKIEIIDQTAIQDALFTRRAYFEYAKAGCTNCPVFPRCQTLKIIVKEKI